jgi:cobalt-zinc-cadmium efflux system protein
LCAPLADLAGRRAPPSSSPGAYRGGHAGTPRHISLADVEQRIATVPGVTAVPDLHVWTVTSGVVAMSGHAVVLNPSDNQRVLESVQDRLEEIGIRHVTLQIERDPTCS